MSNFFTYPIFNLVKVICIALINLDKVYCRPLDETNFSIQFFFKKSLEDTVWHRSKKSIPFTQCVLKLRIDIVKLSIQKTTHIYPHTILTPQIPRITMLLRPKTIKNIFIKTTVNSSSFVDFLIIAFVIEVDH